jgi:hypothetical protein
VLYLLHNDVAIDENGHEVKLEAGMVVTAYDEDIKDTSSI